MRSQSTSLPWLLVAAFYVLLFSNHETWAMTSQLTSVFLVMLSALIVLATGKVQARQLTFFEIMLFLAGILSLFTAPVFGGSYSSMFTLVFLVVIVGLTLNVRAYDSETIFRSVALTYLFFIWTILIFDLLNFLNALRIEFVYGVSLFRFRPFNMHPNLTGLVFGAGVLILYSASRLAQGYAKQAYLFGAVISGLIVLAASARAGLLAVALAILISQMLRPWRVTVRGVVLTILTGIVLIAGIVVLWQPLSHFLESILELNSITRGWGSGATGRFQMWNMGLNLIITQDLAPLFLGSGLRSASVEQIGFSTENSYISIILDNGVIIGGGLLGVFCITTARIVQSPATTEHDRIYKNAMVSLLFFALIHSFFNRYLLAIGNPFSLYLLFLVSSVFVWRKTVERPGSAQWDTQEKPFE